MRTVPRLRSATTNDGVTVAYTSGGAGRPLVWMPSLGNLIALWRVPTLRRAYEALGDGVELILYDGRGTGSSQRAVDPATLGLDGQLADLDAVIAASGAGRVSLLGYYHSVPAAIAYAATHPDRIDRLVLFGGSLRLRDTMSPAQTQALLSLVDQDWNLFAESAAHIWLGWASGESGRLIAESIRDAVSPTVARAIFAEAASIDVSAFAGRVTCPVLVLHRQGPGQMPVELSRELAESLPHGRLEILAGDTPTLFYPEPADDVRRILEFLGDEPPRPRTAPDGLTPREAEVLGLVATGASNAEIGAALTISVHTVERHAANAYRKIGARNRADATAYAIRQRLGPLG